MHWGAAMKRCSVYLLAVAMLFCSAAPALGEVYGGVLPDVLKSLFPGSLMQRGEIDYTASNEQLLRSYMRVFSLGRVYYIPLDELDQHFNRLGLHSNGMFLSHNEMNFITNEMLFVWDGYREVRKTIYDKLHNHFIGKKDEYNAVWLDMAYFWEHMDWTINSLGNPGPVCDSVDHETYSFVGFNGYSRRTKGNIYTLIESGCAVVVVEVAGKSVYLSHSTGGTTVDTLKILYEAVSGHKEDAINPKIAVYIVKNKNHPDFTTQEIVQYAYKFFNAISQNVTVYIHEKDDSMYYNFKVEVDFGLKGISYQAYSDYAVINKCRREWWVENIGDFKMLLRFSPCDDSLYYTRSDKFSKLIYKKR